MRAVCHLDKASNTGTGPKPKMTLLLFPRSAEEMNLLLDSMQSPAWPDIRILQVTGEFFPKMPNWRDPICPLLLLGSMYHEAPHLPSLADIRFNIAATMKSARLPTACTSSNSLTRLWNKALSDVGPSPGRTQNDRRRRGRRAARGTPGWPHHLHFPPFPGNQI
jgi:hypothetical protein